MKYLSIINIILALFIMSLPTTLDAAVGDDSCWIKAGKDDVFVRVFDLDSSGNVIPPRTRGDSHLRHEIWKGSLENGQEKLIESSNGRIRYDYKRSSDYLSYGGNTASCINGEIIRLP